MPEREITESGVEALGRALGLGLTSDEVVDLTQRLLNAQREMASLDGLEFTDVEPAVGFRPYPPARPR